VDSKPQKKKGVSNQRRWEFVLVQSGRFLVVQKYLFECAVKYLNLGATYLSFGAKYLSFDAVYLNAGAIYL